MALDELLDNIEAWLHTNAATTFGGLGPPATTGDVSQVEDLLGFPLPASLRALFQWHNGSGGSANSFDMIPDYSLISLSECLGYWRTRNAVYREDLVDITSESRGWSPQWIPFATDYCGDLLVVGTAISSYPDQVFVVDKVDGRLPFHVWSDLKDLLTDLLDALRNDGTIAGHRVAVTNDQRLSWQPIQPN